MPGANLVAAVQAELPAVAQVGPVALVADGQAVCEHARSGMDGRKPQDVLINVHHVQMFDDLGRFARLAVTHLCPEMQPALDEAVAFDAFMRGVTTTTQPPPTAAPATRSPPTSRPQASPPTASGAPTNTPSRLVYEFKVEGTPCCSSMRTEAFTVTGNWRLEYGLGWVVSSGADANCTVSGSVRNADGSASGLDTFSGGGTKNFSSSGTYRITLHRECENEAASTGGSVKVFN